MRSSPTINSFLCRTSRRFVVKLCECESTLFKFLMYSQWQHSYPPLVGVMRTCVASYTYSVTPVLMPSSTQSGVMLPLSAPTHDVNGRKIHEIFIPKDTNVFLHIWNLNRDPSIWGHDAADWKPERWLAPLPASVEAAKIQGVYANM